MADRPHRRHAGGSFARAAVVVVGLVALGWLIASGIPSLNPFATDRVDRSPPAVLRSIERLSEYRAATARLQQVVDIEDDATYLPDFLKGTRTLLVASGQVDAIVDFDGLGRGAVEIDEDRRSATITLPSPRLAEPQLDLERTRVYDRDRGLFDRIESVFEDSPTEDRSVLLLAEEKLAEAARADPQLVEAAERNTRQMLTGLLRGLGFTDVTVVFEPPAV